MAFCLTKETKLRFKEALKNREINPMELATMKDSVTRRNFLAKYVGESNAERVNALFESKMLLKSQKRGYITWSKKIAGISPAVRRDLLAKIERLGEVLTPKQEEVFLQDLVNMRLNLNVTQEESVQLADYAKKLATLKEKYDAKADKWTNNRDEDQYGWTQAAYEEYVNDIKLEAKDTKFSQQKIKKTAEAIGGLPGLFKSLQSSWDNSFFGRQGVKVLADFKTSHIWVKAFLKSFGDIAKELGGIDAMIAVKAEIYSRPNSVNGKYTAGKFGLDVLSEEAYPSAVPEKIPVLKRLFKASSSAYNAAALRMRADLADRLISMAEKNGVNTLSSEEMRPTGNLVGSLTGRGSLGKFESAGPALNVLLYSVKFLKSNIDTLLAPAAYVKNKVAGQIGFEGYKNKGAEFAGKQAALSTLRIIFNMASVLSMAKLIDPDAVDEDPRSTNFGKIKVFGHWVDISGGMSALVRLAARLTPTYHNGVRGMWSKSSEGKWTNLDEKGYFKRNALDEIEDFAEGKLAPVAGILRDRWKGELFGGETFTWEKALQNSMTPIPIQTFFDLKNNPKTENLLASMLIEALGFSTSTYMRRPTDWEQSTGKELMQFKEQVGEKEFKKANDAYNNMYDLWYNDTMQKEEYKNLSDESKDKLKTKNKAKAKKMIFDEYDFEYEKEDVDEEEADAIDDLSIE